MDAAGWLRSGEPLANLQTGGRRGILCLVALALLAAWTGQHAAAFLLFAVLAVLLAAQGWAARALRGVSCRFELPEDRAFPGDLLALRLCVENQKALPLVWLRVRCAVPPALTPADAPRRWPYLDRGGYLQGMAALGWYSQATWEFELPCRWRGVYPLGPIELSSGDPFGLFARRALDERQQTIVIYPRIQPLRRLGFVKAPGLGLALRNRTLIEDNSRTAGLRDYRPGDPLRRIHWKATARQGQLQIRLHEPAAAPQLLLVLAADTFDFPWTRYREDLFELGVSAVASIAWRAVGDGWPVGLVANAGTPTRLPPSSSPGQLLEMLEALARAVPSSSHSLPGMVREQTATLTGATVVLVVGRALPSLNTTIEHLQTSRHQVVVLYADKPFTPGARVTAYHLQQWGDLAALLDGPGEVLGGR